MNNNILKRPSMAMQSDSQHDITVFCRVGTFSINMFSRVKGRCCADPSRPVGGAFPHQIRPVNAYIYSSYHNIT